MTDEVRCARDNVASKCCVGDPWADLDFFDPEPLDPSVIAVAEDLDVEPHALDWHVEAVHGFESHDAGYRNAVVIAAKCLKAGGCE